MENNGGRCEHRKKRCRTDRPSKPENNEYGYEIGQERNEMSAEFRIATQKIDRGNDERIAWGIKKMRTTAVFQPNPFRQVFPQGGVDRSIGKDEIPAR